MYEYQKKQLQQSTTDRHRVALTEFIAKMNYSVFLTCNFNYKSTQTEETMRKTLKRFSAGVNRKRLHTPKWYKKDPSLHLHFDAFGEKQADFPHWHILCKVDLIEIPKLIGIAKQEWQSIKGTSREESGFDAKIITSAYDMARYITKEKYDITHVNWTEFTSKEFKT